MTDTLVDAIMREIEADAARAGAEPSFPHLALQEQLPQLHEYHSVDPRPPLVARTRYERLWVRINQFLRRIAAHAVEPAVAQQNEFNTVLRDALEQLVHSDAALRAAIVALRAEQRAADQDPTRAG